VIRATIATIALLAATVTAASAQWYSGQNGYGNRPAEARGVVTSFNWYDLHIQSRNGRDEYIHLHQGTAINPRGTTLRDGMPVRAVGYIDGNGTFQANEVDVAGNQYGYCENSNGGYYGNGAYGTGYYSGNSSNGNDCGRRRRHHDNDNDGDDRGYGNGNGDTGYRYPNPYPTYPPRR